MDAIKLSQKMKTLQTSQDKFIIMPSLMDIYVSHVLDSMIWQIKSSSYQLGHINLRKNEHPECAYIRWI